MDGDTRLEQEHVLQGRQSQGKEWLYLIESNRL